MIEFPDYEPAFAAAIKSFWSVRAGQTAKNLKKGSPDAGTRGSVTGGAHLNAVRDVIHRVITDAGMKPAKSSQLPSYYRPAKNWDIVVMNEGAVVAIVELKSQVGSIGKNLNNRVEEMMGQSLDIWRATREHLLGPMRPWFGYVMILEADEKSTRSQTPNNTLLPVDAAFNKASYVDQNSIALNRLRLEGDMNSVCLATTSKSAKKPKYPEESMTFSCFARSLHLRILETKNAR